MTSPASVAELEFVRRLALLRSVLAASRDHLLLRPYITRARADGIASCVRTVRPEARHRRRTRTSGFSSVLTVQLRWPRASVCVHVAAHLGVVTAGSRTPSRCASVRARRHSPLHRPRPNHALQRTGTGGGFSSDLFVLLRRLPVAELESVRPRHAPPSCFDASSIQWQVPWMPLSPERAHRAEAEFQREAHRPRLVRPQGRRCWLPPGLRRLPCFHLGDPAPCFAVIHLHPYQREMPSPEVALWRASSIRSRRGPSSAWFPTPQTSTRRSVGLTTRSSEQRLAVGFFFIPRPVLASLCR